MADLIQIYTTTGSENEAKRIADILLQKKLVACVQVSGPIRSHYVWQGAFEESTEWMCSIKTLAEQYSRVEAAIREVHTYDEPEIIAVAISQASIGYAAWVSQCVNGGPKTSSE